MSLEGKKLGVPTCKQLKEFENVYKKIINKFVQRRYTKKERREQADKGYLQCVSDTSGKIYAIAIRSCVHGGAFGSIPDCHNNIYAPTLLLYLNKGFYEKIPEDPVARKEYMRSRSIGGWIAKDNVQSWKLHKLLGITATGKAMNQFVLPTDLQ